MSNAKFKEMSKNIEDLILSEEQMSSGQYPENEVYDIKFDNEIIGPIWQQDIREYLQSSNHFKEGTEIKSYDRNEWVHIFEHPLFQRRRPQLISNQALENNDLSYHLLIDGQKHGPYTSFEINSMIETKEILVTDEVSIDDGSSWGALYDIEDFDRRVLKSNEELPNLPKQKVFNDSSKEVDKKLKHFSDEKTNLIAGLAYIGNIRTGKAKEALSKTHQVELADEAIDEIAEESKSFQNYLWQGLFALSVIGLITVFITWSNQKPSETNSKVTPARRVQAKKIEPIKLKPVSKLNNKVEIKEKIKSNSIKDNANVNSRPTSFRRSKAFRQASKPKKALTDDARYPKEDDDFYYDDNTEPVELDPVRSTLSKETIDPEFNDEEFIDEMEGDIESIEGDQSDEVFNEEVEY